MNLGCGVVAVLIAVILGAGALFVATPAEDSTGATAGAAIEASPRPLRGGELRSPPPVVRDLAMLRLDG
jgi:hypothetical protein